MTVAPWALVYSTGAFVQDPTAYKSGIDGNFSAIQRHAGAFAPQASPTPDLRVLVLPGYIERENVLTQLGAWINGTLTNASPNITAASSIYGVTSGLFVTDGLGVGTSKIPSGTTINATPSAGATTIVMSANATGAVTAEPIVVCQRTAALTAPVGNPRKDIVYVDEQTGIVAVVTGTAATPALDPTIPDGVNPICRINWAGSDTAITNSMLDDLRTGRFVPQGGYKGTAVASAATPTLGPGSYFHITGTTGISGYSSRVGGRRVMLYYEGACVLTSGANFLLQGAANRTTAAGDIQELVSDDGTKWFETNYFPATIPSSTVTFTAPYTPQLWGLF